MAWAHSGKNEDRSDWQRLVAHLEGVRDLAFESGTCIGVGAPAGLAGLLHDLGKYDPAFLARLHDGSERVDHSTAGAAALREAAKTAEACAAAELLAYAILGHHAGLPDRRGVGGGTLDARIKGFDLSRLDPKWRSEVPFNPEGVMGDFMARAKGPYLSFDLSVATRMVFSCLIDADRKDTADFYARLDGRTFDQAWPGLQDIRQTLLDRFDAHIAALPGNGEVNRLRRDILGHVRAGAAMPPGLFTLTVPTGGGKTLASLGFALDHAAQGHRRIIYAIPFTSVIEQTAKTFRDVLGDGIVLEHHSAIDDVNAHPEQREKLRLAMEDWAAPVVITTNVQLFESLFAARPSRARKLHNIAGGIIILDEAQTIPRPLLKPCVRMLDALARHWKCSIVLCTATQPALGTDILKDGLDLAGRELAPDPSGMTRRLRRATIRWAGAMDDAALVAALRDTRQGLVIVNGRRHALALYRAAQEAGLDGLVHLTTRRCALDRQAALAEVRKMLETGAPCRVIATSLIEAGVDVDFPAVWRAKAGLDQVVQAAGRCNREGKREAKDSIVTVFDPPDWSPPAEVAGLIGDTERMIGDHADLQSPDAIRAYFEEIYWRIGDGLDRKQIFPRFEITRHGTDFPFRTVAEDFQMIESGMAPVIVPFDAFAERQISQLCVPCIPSGAFARALQPYVVQVPPRDRDRLIANGRAVYEAQNLRGDQFAVLPDMRLYDSEAGLIWEEADVLPGEDFIV